MLFWYIIVISKTENTGVVEMRVFKRKSGGTIDEAESQNKKAGDKFKILIPVCVCVLVVCVVMGVNSYKHIQDGMVEMGVQEADMAADLTLRMLDGDEVEQIVPGAEESDAIKEFWQL